MKIAGIDPGTKTGIAIWNCKAQRFEAILTSGIVCAMETVRAHNVDLVRIEDARKRRWYGNAGREKLQGVGSVKRDCAIWQEFCGYYDIQFQAVAPQKGQTKWSAEYFKRVTGWDDRTSEHSRDAAILVFGEKKNGNRTFDL